MPTGIYKHNSLSEEHKRRLSEAQKGKHHSQETRRKMSETRRGKKHSEETKQRISEACKKIGLRPPSRVGVVLTDEHKKKISLALKGHPPTTLGKHWKLSKETRKKMSKAKKGIKFSDEHKRKISEANMGRMGLRRENHPNWQAGKSFEPYGLEFNGELKEKIRKRDNYRCQECFRHQSELFTKTGRKYKLMVHHIDYNKKNNAKSNLISLCRSCHVQTNFSREDWTKYFLNRGGFCA